ncbi:protein kinase domain-containing protein [Pseudonocardia sp. CA-107938]|uniref:protein kinase domain-containing protein n=1 Tax=Pseudonocardia sp. CA-107938 TaxID=3240021 RepID=UPI003D8DF8CC
MDPLLPTDPRTIGPFRVDGRIGAGGMGQVFLGADPHGRRVAIKVAHSELTKDPKFRERFRREIRMASTIPAWFTAPVLAADPDATPPWLATAFVDGPSLQERVREGGPLPAAQVAALGARLAAGLAIVHATGLVHRDLKPANVILSAQGPRLIDFGIARGLGATNLTGTGNLMGTPSFMSPEQATGSRDVGPYSDVFALGALLVYASTGASPFDAGTVAGSIYKIVNTVPDVSAVPEPLRGLVRSCLSRDPAARPTAAQVQDALGGDRFTVPPPVTVPLAARPAPPLPAEAPTDRTPVPTTPRRARGRLAAIALVLALVTVGGVWLATRAPGVESGAAPADVTSDGQPVDASVDPRFGTGGALFRTPSGNIACRMDPNEVRCDVGDRTWTVPARPPGCTGAWATGATISGSGEGTLSCVADDLGGSPAVLGYGESVRLGQLVCVSRQTGVRCENGATLHGFAVSRTSFELF